MKVPFVMPSLPAPLPALSQTSQKIPPTGLCGAGMALGELRQASAALLSRTFRSGHVLFLLICSPDSIGVSSESFPGHHVAPHP